MKKIFVVVGLLLVISCNTGPYTSGPDQQTFTGTTYNITPGELCTHNLSSFRGTPAADVVSAPTGTVYECTSSEVHVCTGGQTVTVGHFVDNTQSEPFTLQLHSDTEFSVSGSGLVEIIDPVNVSILDADGNWVPITTSGSYTTDGILVGVGGSATVSTTDVVIVDRSGADQNG